MIAVKQIELKGKNINDLKIQLEQENNLIG